jgi:hypothetical protein
MTLLSPTSSGSSKLHDAVPFATPERDPARHVTSRIPLPSRAVPLMIIVDADVDTMVSAGDVKDS